MSIDPEELKRRRANRKLQREKQQRSLKVKLIVAAVVLILCGVLIAALAAGKNDAANTTLSTSEQTQPDQTVIHFAAAGDLNITEAVVQSGGANYDYTKALLDVAPLLANADITAINFEGNLYGMPYGTDRSAPQNLANALAKAGVDLVQLANSFSIYKGMEGLKSTVDGIRLAGMQPVGACSADEAKDYHGYTVCTVQGVKIVFVAFTKGMDGMALPPGNEGCVNVLYTDYSTDYQKVDTEGISKTLDAAAKEKPDLMVALVHWGSEFNNTVSESQEQIRKLLQSKGVDAIIGTHSHYVQKMTFDPDAGTFVAYSLGDFLSDAKRAGSEYSVVLDLEITKNNTTGETKITNYSYVPIFTVAEEGKPLRTLRIGEAIKAFEDGYIDRVSQQTYDSMKYALERIESRINGK